ncbi:hypothetical protein HMPREF9004_0845 [Schaalia cardiffensis F0333]|uniref:Uncharacterized protein n=1 Tax=Schaalia cardiffensis F0333 TaxID=888050 RepID=N6X3L7_9ACTO|nr:hypothetical protein HMPREF9004_0845 [Schaalia cardiffensis F0333]
MMHAGCAPSFSDAVSEWGLASGGECAIRMGAQTAAAEVVE